MPQKPAKANPKAVQPPFTLTDTKKFGTMAQQIELDAFLKSLNQEQLLVVQALLTRMSTGACFNGDGTIDADGLRTTGGYRKSIHYMKAYFANRPTPVQLA